MPADVRHRRRDEGHDIELPEPNIHAGTNYMDQLMTRYFPDVKFSEANRSLFAFAAYDAGPGRIAGMVKSDQAQSRPNKWFNNVVIVTAGKVGIETTTFARNIFKYTGVQADARS